MFLKIDDHIEYLLRRAYDVIFMKKRNSYSIIINPFTYTLLHEFHYSRLTHLLGKTEIYPDLNFYLLNNSGLIGQSLFNAQSDQTKIFVADDSYFIHSDDVDSNMHDIVRMCFVTYNSFDDSEFVYMISDDVERIITTSTERMSKLSISVFSKLFVDKSVGSPYVCSLERELYHQKS